MALLSELMSSIIILVTRPCIIFKLICFFGLRTAFILLLTWTELAKATIYLHLNLLWKMFMWTVAFVSLPIRVMSAIWRERQLEMHLHYMQSELENLAWDRKQVEKNLQIAIKEHKMMELILAELEEEHDKAIAKIQLLQDELRELKNENLRLMEVERKGFWSKRLSGSADETIGTGIGRGRTSQVFVDQRSRGTAITQSVFSAVLSFLVGMIIWEAEDPCVPLVVALFTVVVMSLRSVVQFLSTINNKPASDAVALLSLNWFILGTLTYPTLPRLAPILAPLASRLVDPLLRFAGLSFS